MVELLVVGSLIFIAYTISQGQRANLAVSNALRSNTLIQNTNGRAPVQPGAPGPEGTGITTRFGTAAVIQPTPISQAFLGGPTQKPLPCLTCSNGNGVQTPVAPVPTPVAYLGLPASGAMSLSTATMGATQDGIAI